MVKSADTTGSPPPVLPRCEPAAWAVLHWAGGRLLKPIPALAALALALAAAPPPPVTRVSAHRGDNKAAPENTLPAFLSAVRKGAHQIEFDVKFSRDGALVILHDRILDRTTNGRGAVSDLTFRQLRALDAGTWFSPRFAGARIPTLREVLEVIHPAILCNVHLDETPGLGAAAARLIVEMGRARQCILACTKEQAAAAKAIAPDLRICNMSGPRGQLQAYVRQTIEQRADFIQIRSGTEGLAGAVALLHRQGIRVNYFSAQEAPLIRRLVEAGVDYILTDDLDLCLAVLAEYGVRPVRGTVLP